MLAFARRNCTVIPLVVAVAVKLVMDAGPASDVATNNERFETSRRKAMLVFRFRPN